MSSRGRGTAAQDELAGRGVGGSLRLESSQQGRGRRRGVGGADLAQRDARPDLDERGRPSGGPTPTSTPSPRHPPGAHALAPPHAVAAMGSLGRSARGGRVVRGRGGGGARGGRVVRVGRGASPASGR